MKIKRRREDKEIGGVFDRMIEDLSYTHCNISRLERVMHLFIVSTLIYDDEDQPRTTR